MEQLSHEIAKKIRREFFVYRNGLLADTLRNAGDPHKLIFGLNLSQLTDIVRNFSPDEDVATELWNSKDTRECRLVAPMLYPADKFNEDKAIEWCAQVENTEIADNLCHKLLRNVEYAPQLCLKLSESPNSMERYIAMQLAINLAVVGKAFDTETLQKLAQNELDSSISTHRQVARRLIEDIQELQSL